jgi:hypothetical protein
MKSKVPLVRLFGLGGMDAAVSTALGGVLPQAKLPAKKSAWTLIFLAAIVFGFAACSDGNNNNGGGGGNQTPVAGDYTFGNLSQTAESVTAVTITPKSGKSGGARTIYYDDSTTIPQTVGKYAVTFDVAAATGWNTATGLYAGNLIVGNQTPVAFDYTFKNMSQMAWGVMAVTVTPKEDKSSGAITIYYEGVSPTNYTKSTTLPTTGGTYAVTFDVAAVEGWNAETGLSAGNLVINSN